jgi:transcriptional regulator with XRE-family HTH domain
VDEGLLYRIVGERIRAARERQAPRMSQAALAEKVQLTRVSIVNIEAGRQHPPLHLLWRIAEVLETELFQLIPRHEELVGAALPLQLDSATVAQIEEAANGDLVAKRHLSQFISEARQRTRQL